MAGGKAAQSSRSGDGISNIGKAKQFIADCNEEIKKVSTPTRAETVQATIVTVVILVLVSSFLALADWMFREIMFSVLS